MKSFVSQFFLIKLTSVLATSAADRPLIPSCQSTPAALCFAFFDPPIGGNVSLNTTICLQKTTTLNPGSLSNMITFCISTDVTFSLSVHSWFFSSRYLSLPSVAVLIWSSKSTISAHNQQMLVFYFFHFHLAYLIHVCLICEYLLSVYREGHVFHTPLLQALQSWYSFFFYFLAVTCVRNLNIFISVT